jgi:acetyl esterase/lipase
MGGTMPAPDRPSVRAVDTSYSSGGSELPARIFVPADKGGDSLPVVVFLHGGGWIAGNINAAAGICLALASELGAVVISPSYRLAPEHPFPAAIHDAIAALSWAAEVAAEHGGDKRRLAVVGESAGGTLAAIAAQQLRDAGGPPLAAGALIYPPIDPQASTASRLRYRNGPILSAALLDRMWSTYLGDARNDQSSLADPSKAKSLEGLPPTLVVTVELDPSRDESEDYARQLAHAGVATEIVRISGLAHGTLPMSALVPRASEILEAVVAFLRAHLTAPQPAASRLPSQSDPAYGITTV